MKHLCRVLCRDSKCLAGNMLVSWREKRGLWSFLKECATVCWIAWAAHFFFFLLGQMVEHNKARCTWCQCALPPSLLFILIFCPQYVCFQKPYFYKALFSRRGPETGHTVSPHSPPIANLPGLTVSAQRRHAISPTEVSGCSGYRLIHWVMVPERTFFSPFCDNLVCQSRLVDWRLNWNCRSVFLWCRETGEGTVPLVP